jgi:hypothetical protein
VDKGWVREERRWDRRGGEAEKKEMKLRRGREMRFEEEQNGGWNWGKMGGNERRGKSERIWQRRPDVQGTRTTTDDSTAYGSTYSH